MRAYKHKAALSLNPILDVMFLETNNDQTPFPSLQNRHKVKKSQSMKTIKPQKDFLPSPSKFRLVAGDRQEIVAGFRMSYGNGFGQVKKKRALTYEKDEEQMKETQRLQWMYKQKRQKRSATVVMTRTPVLQKQKSRVMSYRLRETIDQKLQQRLEHKNRNKQPNLFQIVMSSYRDFQ